MDELTSLLLRISDAEDFVERAEAFYKEKNHQWPEGLVINFEKFLEQKRDQICQEKERVRIMGWNTALRDLAETSDIMENL